MHRISYNSDLGGQVIEHLEYIAFGETFVQERREDWATPYRFTGQEQDCETGLYYHSARYMDTRTCRFLSVDRYADKYPDLSPYVYAANNPLAFIDPTGDTLDVGNIKSSLSDLRSLANKSNRSRIVADVNGRVDVDMSGLGEDDIKKILKRDKGLSLIYAMVNSTKKMLYSTADYEVFGNMRIPISVGQDFNGVINASSNGKDGNYAHTYLPREGYDGQLSLSLYGRWLDSSGNSARKSVLFHELAENLYRSRGIDYHPVGNSLGAHQLAINLEGSRYGNNNPGAANYVMPVQSDAQKKVFRQWKIYFYQN